MGTNDTSDDKKKASLKGELAKLKRSFTEAWKNAAIQINAKSDKKLQTEEIELDTSGVDEKVAKLQKEAQQNNFDPAQRKLIQEYQSLPFDKKGTYQKEYIGHEIRDLIQKGEDIKLINFIRQIKENSPQPVMNYIIGEADKAITKMEKKSEMYTALSLALYFNPTIENAKNALELEDLVKSIILNVPKIYQFGPNSDSRKQEHEVVKNYIDSLIKDGKCTKEQVKEILSKSGREDLSGYVFKVQENKFAELEERQKKGITELTAGSDIDLKCRTLKILGCASTGDRGTFSFGGKGKMMKSAEIIDMFSRTEKMVVVDHDGGNIRINPLAELAKADSDMLKELLDYSLKKGGIEAFKKMSKAASEVLEKEPILPEKSKILLQEFAAGSNLAKLKASAKYMQGQLETGVKAIKRGLGKEVGR